MTDKSDLYISIIATKTPKPHTLGGWWYELRLEQEGKTPEDLGLYEKEGVLLISLDHNLKYPSIPFSMVDVFED